MMKKHRASFMIILAILMAGLSAVATVAFMQPLEAPADENQANSTP